MDWYQALKNTRCVVRKMRVLAAFRNLVVGAVFSSISHSTPAASIVPAQPYPTKPIRVLAQFAAGSSTDTTARIVAQKLTERLGQQVVIDNRPGAGGVVGAELAARANPDGYTLTMAPSIAFGSAPFLYTKPPYDPVKDFEAISNLVTSPQVRVASTTTGFATLRDSGAKAD